MDSSCLRCYVDGERVNGKIRFVSSAGNDIWFVEQQVGGMTEENEAEDSAKAADAPITLKVRDQAGDIMFFKVKKSTEMRKIFDAYAQRLGVTARNLKFSLDGERIKETDTPKMLELNDEDQVDVFLEQVGGSQQEDVKPTGDDAVITIKVREPNGNEIAFKVKKSTKMSKIFEAFASRKGVELNAIRFLTPEGERVTPEHTPKMLELEDEGHLDVRIEQLGGNAFVQ